MVHQVERGAGGTAAGSRVRLEPYPARRYERVLGRDEDRVPEHEQEDREDAEGVAHAPPFPGEANVLDGSSKLARSIGDDPDVLGPLRPLLEHEPFEMRERLSDCEAA